MNSYIVNIIIHKFYGDIIKKKKMGWSTLYNIYYWSKLQNFVTINLVKNRKNKNYVKKSHKICISDIYNVSKLFPLPFIKP